MFQVSINSSVVASNVEPDRPPLDRLFQQRFGSDWTAEEEAAALEKIHEMGTESDPERSATRRQEETISTVFYNQHEDLSSPGPALSRRDIAEAIQRKKRR